MTPLNPTQELVLDLRGLRCPQPVLRAKKAMRRLQRHHAGRSRRA